MTARNDDDGPAVKVGMEIMSAMDKEFHDAPDRVLAIVGGAYLDSLLKELLRAVFVDDEKVVNDFLGMYGPLSSNRARYNLAYCLGLIDGEQREDLQTIAKIRNKFAHRYDLHSFEDAEPGKHIAKLHVGEQLDDIVGDLVNQTSDPLERQALQKIGASGRRKFQDTVRNLFMVLLRKIDAVVRANESTWFPRRNSDQEGVT